MYLPSDDLTAGVRDRDLAGGKATASTYEQFDQPTVGCQ